MLKILMFNRDVLTIEGPEKFAKALRNNTKSNNQMLLMDTTFRDGIY
jgi:pyruvate carboxylase